MKAFTTFLFLILLGCGNGGTPFAAPSLSEVSGITAALYNRPDGGTDIARFEIPESSFSQVLAALDGAGRDKKPPKWQVLGHIEITLTTGTVDVGLFWTDEEVGAFRVDGNYYRGGSDTAFIQLITAAKNEAGDQGGAGPSTPSAGR